MDQQIFDQLKEAAKDRSDVLPKISAMERMSNTLTEVIEKIEAGDMDSALNKVSEFDLEIIRMYHECKDRVDALEERMMDLINSRSK